MRLIWTSKAWEDYVFWQNQDRKTLRRINDLLKDMLRHPLEGIGKPEPLKGSLSGYWSRRINHEHRIVYAAEDAQIVVIACRHHYS
jgi:toxin YoeB